MTSDGFASAVNSFIAQNHGAGKEDRIHAGYRSALKIVLPWGLFCTILLVCFPTPIFKIFITEPDVIPMGISYLMILGFSQLFTSLEITTSGAFLWLWQDTAAFHYRNYFESASNPDGTCTDCNATGT